MTNLVVSLAFTITTNWVTTGYYSPTAYDTNEWLELLKYYRRTNYVRYMENELPQSTKEYQSGTSYSNTFTIVTLNGVTSTNLHKSEKICDKHKRTLRVWSNEVLQESDDCHFDLIPYATYDPSGNRWTVLTNYFYAPSTK